jgi:hypothetical protein
MSIRILTLATAAATTLEGSIVRRQVRLVKVRKATHRRLWGAKRTSIQRRRFMSKRRCEETSMAQPEHNTRQSNRREL